VNLPRMDSAVSLVVAMVVGWHRYRWSVLLVASTEVWANGPLLFVNRTLLIYELVATRCDYTIVWSVAGTSVARRISGHECDGL
jgi:hypothetical protein